MAEITLTQGHVAIVDDDDADWISQWTWYWKRERSSQGHAVRQQAYTPTGGGRRRQRTVLMQRVITGVDGQEASKDGLWVWHKNGNKLDNRRENLAVGTPRDLLISHRYRQSKIVTGVFKRGERFIAMIAPSRQPMIYLGTFDKEIDASRAYDEAAIKYFGSNAVRNSFTPSTVLNGAF